MLGGHLGGRLRRQRQGGLLPRSDSWVGHDYVQFYKDNGAPVRYDGGVDLQ